MRFADDPILAPGVWWRLLEMTVAGVSDGALRVFAEFSTDTSALDALVADPAVPDRVVAAALGNEATSDAARLAVALDRDHHAHRHCVGSAVATLRSADAVAEAVAAHDALAALRPTGSVETTHLHLLAQGLGVNRLTPPEHLAAVARDVARSGGFLGVFSNPATPKRVLRRLLRKEPYAAFNPQFDGAELARIRRRIDLPSATRSRVLANPNCPAELIDAAIARGETVDLENVADNPALTADQLKALFDAATRSASGYPWLDRLIRRSDCTTEVLAAGYDEATWGGPLNGFDRADPMGTIPLVWLVGHVSGGRDLPPAARGHVGARRVSDAAVVASLIANDPTLTLPEAFEVLDAVTV